MQHQIWEWLFLAGILNSSIWVGGGQKNLKFWGTRDPNFVLTSVHIIKWNIPYWNESFYLSILNFIYVSVY